MDILLAHSSYTVKQTPNSELRLSFEKSGLNG